MLKVLCLEDSPQDVEIIRELLTDAGYDLTMDCTAVEKEFVSFLRVKAYDIILSDFKLPGFDGFTALRWAMEICPDVPFICVSGTIGEERAVELLNQGAVDFVIKDRLARLPAAIKRALEVTKEKETRKRAEEAVRESENKYRDMVEQINDVIYMTDANGTFTYISPMVEFMSGYKPEEMIGHPMVEFLDPLFLPKIKQQFKKIMVGIIEPMEYRVKIKSGEFRWVRSSSRPILKENTPIGIRGVLTDITDRKQAEETLAKLNKAVETSGEAIFLTDTKGIFTYVNPGFTATYDYTAAEVVGKVTPRILKSGLPGSDNYKMFWKALLGGQEVRGEHVNKRKDGRLINIDGSASPIFDEKKNLIGFLGIQRDITERKRAEEEIEILSRFPKENPNPVLRVMRDGKLLYANPASKTLLRLWNCAVGEYLPPDWKERVTKVVEQNTSTTLDVECENLFYSMMISTIPEVNYVNIYARDITERMQAEKILRESESRAKAMYQAIPDMIFRLDRQGIFLDYKADIKDLYAQSIPTIIGKRNRDLTPPEFADLIDSMIHTTLVNKTPQIFEYQLPAPGGGVKNYEARMVTSGVDEVTAIVRDITERKRAEDALRESELKLRTVADFTNDWEYWEKENHEIAYISPSCERITGYSPQEFMADPALFGKIVHPEDVDHVNRSRERVFTTKQKHEVDELEFRIIHKNGSVVHLYHVCRPIFDASDQYHGKRISNRDITERKLAELASKRVTEELHVALSKYKTLFDCFPLGVTVSDEVGNILESNSAAEKLLSVSKDEQLNRDIDSSEWRIVRPDGTPMPPDEYASLRALKQQAKVENVEMGIVKSDNMITWINVTAAPLPLKGYGVVIIYNDITERKRVEEALRQSEERYKLMFESASIAINITHGTEIMYANPSYLMMFGLSSLDELRGYAPLELFAPEWRPQILENIQRRAKNLPVPKSYEVECLRKDGSKFPVIMNMVRTMFADGPATVGFIMDITERKRAEENLLESEERFRSLYENSTIGLYRTTPDGKIILANPTLVKMLGYSSFEELAVRNLEQEGFEPSYERKQFIELIQLYGEVKGLESAWNRKDGSIIYIRESARAINDPDGKTLYYDGSVEDITERKQAEDALVYERNLLKALMNNVPDQIYFKDLNSHFLRLSKSLAERFGLSDPAQAIGKTDFDFFTEDHAKPAYEHEQEIIKTGLPLVNIEEKETWPGGHETWVSTTKVPLRDPNGQITGTFGISRDITEQKKMQSQLLQTQKVQSIGTLAGGIAHDFNNILGIILAFTSLLDRSEGNKEKILKSTTAITQAVSRGAALVRQILTFARQTSAAVKPMDISGLICEIVNMLKETFPEVIEFRTIIENNIPFINADQTQLHQVLLNLCVNARDAMPKGGVITIEVKTVLSETLIQQFPEARNDSYIFISVSDTGTGMNEATRSRIFDPFFTTKEQGKGTGLGLSVVHGVIQDHHGFISVESAIGQGTTFHLYLPIPQEENKYQEIKNFKAEEQQRGSETILFIEDEQLLREVVQSSLESNGYKVLLATDGREAVEIYKKQHTDIALVLSDMGLPKLGGIDVYAILKEINPNIKIIFASGFISLETRSELFKTGVKGIIQKPYSVHEVLQMVRDVLDEK